MNERRRLVRAAAGFSVLALALLGLLIANVMIGSVDVAGFWSGTLSGTDLEVARRIVMDIRMPRAYSAALLGAAVSVSGFLLQTFFANPIAGPYVLGISSAAKLAVALVMVFALSAGMAISSAVLVGSAFVGSLIAMLFILLISRKVSGMPTLVVAGVMVGNICSAVTDFVITFADDSDIVNLHNWSLGSFSGISWDNVVDMTFIVVPALVFAFLLSKSMASFQMGEAYARSVGVNVSRFKILVVVLSSFLSACVTAFAGPVSFVGIAVPHIVKRLFGTSRPLIVLPGCVLCGAVFCLMCDLVARTAFAPTELAIGSVTAVIGAPFVIVLMLDRRNARMRRPA